MYPHDVAVSKHTALGSEAFDLDAVRDPLARFDAVLAARRRPMSERLELALSWNALAADLRRACAPQRRAPLGRVTERDSFDARSLFRALAHHDVEYVTIGGIAIQAHGGQRLTQDLDVAIASSPENFARLEQALRAIDARILGPDGGPVAHAAKRTPASVERAMAPGYALRFARRGDAP